MIKRVYMIHGWDGNPDNCWFPWLKQELEKAGFLVIIPAMPHPEKPTIQDWVGALKNIVKPGEDVFLVGHSIGCQTIMRYLESLDENEKFGGVCFVAGFVNLTLKSFEDEGSKEIAEPWLSTPINWEKVRSHAYKFTAFFSDNDPFVPVSDGKIFKEKLRAKIIVEHNKGHFDDEAGSRKLLPLLKEIIRLSAKS